MGITALKIKMNTLNVSGKVLSMSYSLINNYEVADWLEFGRYLKMRRDKIIAGGYWLPWQLSSTLTEQWVELTEEMRTELLSGESIPLELRCPICRIKRNFCYSINVDYEDTPISRTKMTVVHLEGRRCAAYSDSLNGQIFSQYINDLRTTMWGKNDFGENGQYVPQ